MRNKKENIEIPEVVEKRLQEAYQQIGVRSKKKAVWNKGLVVAAAVAVLVAGIGTPYVAEGKFSVRELFAGIWGNETEQVVVDKISSDVEVVKERSTFDKISIEPVQAIVDQMGAYVVLKVTGINGFALEKDMTINHCSLGYNGDSLPGGYEEFVLKRGENVLYYATEVLLDKPVDFEDQPIIHLKTLGGLVRCGIDEYGHPSPRYVEQGDDTLVMDKSQIVFGNVYEADIRCKNRSGDMVSVPIGDGVTAKIYPLGVYVNKDLFDRMGLTSLSEEYRKAHILLKHGKEVKAALQFGTSGKSTVLEPEEPVDPKQVEGIRIFGETYLAE